MAAGSMHFQCLYKAGKPLHMLRSSMAKCRSNPPCMIILNDYYVYKGKLQAARGGVPDYTATKRGLPKKP